MTTPSVPPAFTCRPASLRELRDGLASPPDHHTMTTMWTWVGAPTVERLVAQVDEMIERGIRAAVVMPIPPFEPGFLTDAHLSLLRGVADAAAERGFRLWLSADYSFPAGDGRVITDEGPRSRVLDTDPEARMRRLALRRPGDAIAGEPLVEVAVTTDEAGTPIASRLRLLDGDEPAAGEERWSYELVEAMGVDGGLVDLMRPGTARTFAEQILAPMLDALGEHVGTTVVGIYADHEGSYGKSIAWTEALFARFEEQHGYRLEPLLPLLGFDDAEGVGARVRCDYLATAGSLYASAFFGGLTAWCAERGLVLSGHVFEEAMQLLTAHVGDQFAVQRAIGLPGFDSLFDWGLSPRHAKEPASVAAQRGVELTADQGVLGVGSFKDLQEMRRVSGALGVWGVSRFLPFLVSSEPDMIGLEPMGSEQPWWDELRPYADLVRRISFVNARTEVDVDVAVLHPREHFAASSWPLFEPNALAIPPFDSTASGTEPADIFSKIVPDFRWNTGADADEDVYDAIQETLAEARRDYLVVDADAVHEGVEEGRLRFGASRCPAIVLPPTTWLPAETARALRAFHDGGGTAIAVGRVPSRGVDPADDAAVRAAMQAIFADGRGVVLADAAELPEALTNVLGETLVSGPAEVRVARRRATDGEVHLIANLGREPVTVSVASDAELEIWSADDGTPAALDPPGASVRCFELGPGELRFLAVGVAEASPARHSVRSPVAAVAPQWRFEPLEATVALRRLKLRTTSSVEAGEALGWHLPHHNDAHWPAEPVGPELLAARRWNVAGPFDNWDWKGLTTRYAPELEPATPWSELPHGAFPWLAAESPGPWVNVDRALTGARGVGMFDRGAVGYAQAVVLADQPVDAELRVVLDTSGDVWLGGEHVLRGWEHKQTVEPRDAFARRVPVRLEAGATTLLVKVARLKRAFLGGMGFMLRVCDADGNPLPGVRVERDAVAAPPAGGVVWYRGVVPPGGVAVELPPGCLAAYRNGQPVGEGRVAVEPHDVLVLVRPASAPLHAPLRLRSGETAIELGSWSGGPLADFIGRAAYRTTLDVPAADAGLVLDCGEVGVTVSASVNGVALGTRVWAPFRFALGDAVRAGENALELVVANTTAARREALAEFRVWNVPITGPTLAAKRERDGLLGPVRLLRDVAGDPAAGRALAQRYLDATERRDAAAMLELYAPGARLVTPEGAFAGHDEIKAMFARAWTGVTATHGELGEVSMEDGELSFAWRAHSALADGREVRAAGRDTMLLDGDGRIMRSTVVYTEPPA